jgi:ribonuclease-3
LSRTLKPATGTADDTLAAWSRSALGHDFADAGLLRIALTHSSHPGESYERLEFLGDRILGAIVASLLYSRFGDSEGKLHGRFVGLVDRGSCAEVARRIGVGTRLFMDKSARNAHVAASENVLGDMTEALIGALYLDGGWPAAEAFVKTNWMPLVEATALAPKDPKSALQEWAQRQGLPIPTYTVMRREGPDHAPRFRVAVSIRGCDPVDASGSSKQEAEKAAAVAMLAAVNKGTPAR